MTGYYVHNFHRLLALLSFVLLLHAPGMARAQSQGLKLRLTPQNGEKTDIRRARTVSLYVEEGEPVSPFFSAGPFTATWEGALTFDDFGMDVTMSARGRGTLRVSVNGEKAFEGDLKGRTRVKGNTVGIQNGKNPLEVTYESPEKGPAWVRLYWSADDFYHEPLPVGQLVHTRTDRMKRRQKLRRGRSLFMNHRCATCHQRQGDHTQNDSRSEMSMDAPDLSAAGTKFKADWMAGWIADPTRYREDARMPATLHGDQETIRTKAEDIAACLATLTEESASGPEVNVSDELVQKGKRHFRRFGCVACHDVREREEKEGQSGTSMDRTSLSYVAKKWKPGPLAGYLMHPREHYRWNPMPDFRLDKQKARALAAYLIRTTGDQKPDSGQIEGANPKRGKKLLAKKGCNRCHAGTGAKDEHNQQVPPLHSLFSSDKDTDLHGCLAETNDRRGSAPDFNFDGSKRKALSTFLSANRAESLTRFVPAEFAARQVDRLSCNACHRRDGKASVWSRLPDDQTDVELDQERTKGVKQLRPPLTWVGDMLQYDWLKRTIHGTLDEKTRPLLVARMPGFGPYSTGLAEGLAAQHGYPPERVSYTDSIEKGRKGKEIVESLNCYSCHAAGDRPSNTFEVAGINFVKSGERLHRNFAIRWTLEPGRVRTDTGMPAFFQWGKSSPLSDILNANLDKQMEAIWHYLRNAEQLESK